MNREPSIHVNKSTLTRIISDAVKKDLIVLSKGSNIEELVNYLLESGESHQLLARKILENSKNKKKLNRIKKSSKADANVVAKMISLHRKSLGHRNITKISEESKDWPMLKDLARDIDEFATNYELNIEDALRMYVPAFVKVMGRSFRFNRAKSVHEMTVRHLDCKLEIDADDSPDLTSELHEVYRNVYEEKTGTRPTRMVDYPEQYIHFLYAKDLAIDMNVSFEDLINANFEGLEWANASPEPNQLYGEKAEARLRKYIYSKRKSGNMPTDTAKGQGLNWDFLKKEIE